MKKNIVLVALALLLFVSVTIGVLKTQKLSAAINHEKAAQHQTLVHYQGEQKQVTALQAQYGQLKKEKENFVVSDLTEKVSQFFNDAFNYTANKDTYKTRKADAEQLATPDVVNYFFVDEQSDATPSSVASKVKNLKVYVENSNQSIISGIISFNLSSGSDESAKGTSFTYQFTYDSSSKRLIKVDEMKRYLSDLAKESE